MYGYSQTTVFGTEKGHLFNILDHVSMEGTITERHSNSKNRNIAHLIGWTNMCSFHQVLQISHLLFHCRTNICSDLYKDGPGASKVKFLGDLSVLLVVLAGTITNLE